MARWQVFADTFVEGEGFLPQLAFNGSPHDVLVGHPGPERPVVPPVQGVEVGLAAAASDGQLAEDRLDAAALGSPADEAPLGRRAVQRQPAEAAEGGALARPRFAREHCTVRVEQ